MAELNESVAEVFVDEDLAPSIDGVMTALKTYCANPQGNIDFHTSTLTISGALALLFNSVPTFRREEEVEMFIASVRHGVKSLPAHTDVRHEGGRA